MGRVTEFFHYINQEEINKEEDILYTNLTITDEIEQLRKDNLINKRTNLKVTSDGGFDLF